ncbi:MAG: hypothetical protein J0G30_07435 [Actinomycetales bacterium]|nr:hypothetical protein [Actinomycetales bacterium]
MSTVIGGRHPLDLLATVVGLVLAGLLGLLAGGVLTFVHREQPPWGLVAALAIDAGLVVGLRLVFGRGAAAAAGAGVLAATALLALPGPGGSIVIASGADGSGLGPLGDIWAIAPTVVAAVTVLWPRRVPGRPRRAESPREPV